PVGEGAAAGEDVAVEERRLVALEPRAAAQADDVLEAAVDVALERLEALHPHLVLGEEGIEQRLALARRVEPAADAEAAQQLGEAEAAADDPDRAEDRGLLGEDLVAGEGQPIAARGGDVLGEGEDGDVLLLGELTDAPVDERRLHRRAARRVDREGDRGEAGELESALDRARLAGQAEAAPAAQADDAVEAQHGDDRRRVAEAPDRQVAEEIAKAHG